MLKTQIKEATLKSVDTWITNSAIWDVVCSEK